MLERATACLTPAAIRDTLHSTRKVPRSRRLLHSAFWTHGAGDLDLSPWMLSMPLAHNGKYGSYRSCDDQRSPSDSRESLKQSLQPGGSPHGSVFLDFLYPPQALAWLRRSNSYYQIWEKRNVWRLPEGFMIASRGYASKSRRKGRGQSQADDNEAYKICASEEYKRTIDHTSELPGYGELPGDLDELSVKEAERNNESKSTSVNFLPFGGVSRETAELEREVEEDGENTSSNAESKGFADSPADLTKPSLSGLPRLRSILQYNRDHEERGSGKHGQEAAETAWHIYSSLRESEKSDPRLQTELLAWLVKQQDHKTNFYAQELYKSTLVTQRSLNTYQAALTLFTRLGNLGKATDLHKQALRNIENGQEISKALFGFAVEHENWGLAMNVYDEHRYTFEGTAKSNQLSIFWLHVSELPSIFHKALKLAQHLDEKIREGVADRRFRYFCSRFFKEALKREFLVAREKRSGVDIDIHKVAPSKVQVMLKTIVELDEDESEVFLEAALRNILSTWALYPSEQFRNLIAYFYLEHRKLPNAVPSEDLLLAMITRVTELDDNLPILRKRTSTVNIDMIVNDWERHYEHLNLRAVKRLLIFYARGGQRTNFEKWYDYLGKNHPSYSAQKSVLWTKIYLPARQAKLDQAQQAFAEVKRITDENGEQPDLRCWNLLLHAHSRADDLEGGLTNLQNLIDYANLTPDSFSFHPVVEMFARRGDVQNTLDLLAQYDRLSGQKRTTSLMGSLLQAFAKARDLQNAERVLEELVSQVKTHKVYGTLTPCFNILLTEHAINRDIESVRQVYRWMQTEKIKPNSLSYASLLRCLCSVRKTDHAFKLLRTEMRRQGFEPNSFHYAIVMAGFLDQGMHMDALKVHEHMTKFNVRQSLSTRAAYVRAKAIAENKQLQMRDENGSLPPLANTLRELTRILEISEHDGGIAMKQPLRNSGWMSAGEASPAAYFDSLIELHGRRECIQAVRELYAQYMKVSERDQTDEPAPLRILSALMVAYTEADHFEEVEECWRLAKEMADGFSSIVRVPDLTQSLHARKGEHDALQLAPNPSEEARQGDNNEVHEPNSFLDGEFSNGKRGQLLPDEQSTQASSPAPGRKHILSRPLRSYLSALHKQNCIDDEIFTVTSLLKNGYTLNNQAWNEFIQHLCNHSTPLAMLAFVLTERFLISNFPGWTRTNLFLPIKPSQRQQGFRHMRTQFLHSFQLTPQYLTMVRLGAAYLHLTRLDAGGATNTAGDKLSKYVGTTREVRARAPKTLYALQMMPSVDDNEQADILRRHIDRRDS